METKAQEKNGNTALMLACSNLNVEVVQLLVVFEIGKYNNDGETALMFTSMLNNNFNNN